MEISYSELLRRYNEVVDLYKKTSDPVDLKTVLETHNKLLKLDKAMGVGYNRCSVGNYERSI